MKVTQAGELYFAPGGGYCRGWHIDVDLSSHDLRLQVLCAALNYIAETNGLHGGVAIQAPAPAEPEEALPENFDAQREALDVIAMARWREQGEG